MLTLTGIVQNVYPAPQGTTKEGKSYGGGWKVQLLCNEQLENGSSRYGIVTLGTDHHSWFEQNEQQEVALPVGVIGGRGKEVTYFISKGWTPPQRSIGGASHLAGAVDGAKHSLLDK